MFEPEVGRKQMHCIEEGICDTVGTFRRTPQSFGALVVIRRPENCAPCPFPYAPGWHAANRATSALH